MVYVTQINLNVECISKGMLLDGITPIHVHLIIANKSGCLVGINASKGYVAVTLLTREAGENRLYLNPKRGFRRGLALRQSAGACSTCLQAPHHLAPK